MIIEETAALLETLYGETLKNITIERTVVGVYFTGVKLSNGCGGVSYTPAAELHGSCCSILNTMGQKQGELKGAAVYDILLPPPRLLPDHRCKTRCLDIVGGVVVTDPDRALDILSEGAGAYQLFGVCVRKMNLLRHKPREVSNFA
ncbi:MAG: DUF4213 domain-containing proteins [Syntrophorhabdaceae bacterium]|nr:DUF4213 domain-containing proteins [Syntrophorhabdaceae bacterium]